MSPEPVPPRCRSGDCGEPPAQRAYKGNEAFRAGEYDAAAELFRSALAGLAQPDRGLCLRLGDALDRAGRLPECLGAFRGAARLGALRPDELGELTASLERALCPRELRESPGRAPGMPRDLLGCHRCRRLLRKPVTLPCMLTVCQLCAEPGRDRPPARRVKVVLSGLLEKCFPGECRARRLAGQARNLQHQQQPEAALARCHQALDLAPGDNSLLLLRAELYLSMKNYEQALQDAGKVCQNEPLLPKGHHVKAQALSGLGRSKETLKEFLYCLALNPECNSVKKEAQKVLCEVFFPASENVPQNLTSSAQSILLNTRLKAQCQSHVNSQGPMEEGGSAVGSKNPSEKPVFRNNSSSVLHFILGLHCEEDQEVLDSILPTEPSTGLKRQFPNDSEDAHDMNATEKIPKKEADSLPQRNVNSNTGESEELPIGVADFECALCMSYGDMASTLLMSEYGCMLEIKDIRTFSDGSSVIDAVGISCFRVLSHRRRDGYSMADVEYLEDKRSNPSGPAWS